MFNWNIGTAIGMAWSPQCLSIFLSSSLFSSTSPCDFFPSSLHMVSPSGKLDFIDGSSGLPKTQKLMIPGLPTIQGQTWQCHLCLIFLLNLIYLIFQHAFSSLVSRSFYYPTSMFKITFVAFSDGLHLSENVLLTLLLLLKYQLCQSVSQGHSIFNEHGCQFQEALLIGSHLWSLVTTPTHRNLSINMYLAY